MKEDTAKAVSQQKAAALDGVPGAGAGCRCTVQM